MAYIRILVVDDEELVGRMTQRILGSTLRVVGGWLPEFSPLSDTHQISLQIDAAASASEAIACWERPLPGGATPTRYDLIVTDRDLGMGGANGADVIRYIRVTSKSDVPILFLSGDFDEMSPHDADEIARLVPKAFWVEKPFTPGKLMLIAFAALRPRLEEVLRTTS